jgi:hypothetical protein
MMGTVTAAVSRRTVKLDRLGLPDSVLDTARALCSTDGFTLVEAKLRST